ncbi:hypothetical protein VPHD260_0150 [Vibrio phage D260]
MFSQYKWLAVALVIGAAVASAGWYKAKSDSLERRLEDAIEDVVALQKSLDASSALADRHYALLQAQRETNRELAQESRDKTVEINRYRDREQTVYKKPGLVERLEQKAMDEFMEDLTNGQ